MYIKIENYRRFSIFVLSPIKSPRIYLYRNGFGNARKKIESFVLLYRDIGILSFSASLPSLFSLSPSLTLRRPHARTHIPALYFLFIFAFLSAREREREKRREHVTRSRRHIPSLSIAEALSAVIGPWCHTMGQTMLGTIHPLLASRLYPALTGGTPAHPATHRRRLLSLSLLSWNQHIPANLINIIADYAAPRSQWELRAKRYRRYEAPALCALLFPGFPAERITPTDVPSRICHSRKTSRQGNRKTERGRRRALSQKT